MPMYQHKQHVCSRCPFMWLRDIIDIMGQFLKSTKTEPSFPPALEYIGFSRFRVCTPESTNNSPHQDKINRTTWTNQAPYLETSKEQQESTRQAEHHPHKHWQLNVICWNQWSILHSVASKPQKPRSLVVQAKSCPGAQWSGQSWGTTERSRHPQERHGNMDCWMC